jgi:hypothetical protein
MIACERDEIPGEPVDKRTVRRAQREAVLCRDRAARVAAPDAGPCRRLRQRGPYSRGNTLVMAYPEKLSLRYDDFLSRACTCPAWQRQDQLAVPLSLRADPVNALLLPAIAIGVRLFD